jgi:anti-sigma regulatory factor (Ser/Thr protein kinase)
MACVRSGQAAPGLPADGPDNLTLAVSELAANTLRHSPDGGTLRIWHTPAELISQVTDQGWIEDPLAGRRPPVSDEGGHGLWLDIGLPAHRQGR